MRLGVGVNTTEILQELYGILQVDGYAGYNRQLDRHKNGDIQLAYCWIHVQRKLHNVIKASAARIERTKSNLDAFEKWLKVSRARVSAKSPMVTSKVTLKPCTLEF